MSLDSLPAFVDAIARLGELVRIEQPVRTHLELAEIADRTMKLPGGGPALLFTQPVLDDGTTSPIPVLINAYGSRRRMELALGTDRLDAIGDVDPVAEADVYLAYGRDLQAEEILKEAMRATPDRQAIRLLVGHFYENRENVVAIQGITVAELPMAVRSIVHLRRAW